MGDNDSAGLMDFEESGTSAASTAVWVFAGLVRDERDGIVDPSETVRDGEELSASYWFSFGSRAKDEAAEWVE